MPNPYSRHSRMRKTMGSPYRQARRKGHRLASDRHEERAGTTYDEPRLPMSWLKDLFRVRPVKPRTKSDKAHDKVLDELLNVMATPPPGVVPPADSPPAVRTIRPRSQKRAGH